MTEVVLVWTPSGSCPLCLTPPCYQLQRPPETAALFLGRLAVAAQLSRIRTFRARTIWLGPPRGNH